MVLSPLDPPWGPSQESRHVGTSSPLLPHPTQTFHRPSLPSTSRVPGTPSPYPQASRHSLLQSPSEVPAFVSSSEPTTQEDDRLSKFFTDTELGMLNRFDPIQAKSTSHNGISAYSPIQSEATGNMSMPLATSNAAYSTDTDPFSYNEHDLFRYGYSYGGIEETQATSSVGVGLEAPSSPPHGTVQGAEERSILIFGACGSDSHSVLLNMMPGFGEAGIDGPMANNSTQDCTDSNIENEASSFQTDIPGGYAPSTETYPLSVYNMLQTEGYFNDPIGDYSACDPLLLSSESGSAGYQGHLDPTAFSQHRDSQPMPPQSIPESTLDGGGLASEPGHGVVQKANNTGMSAPDTTSAAPAAATKMPKAKSGSRINGVGAIKRPRSTKAKGKQTEAPLSRTNTRPGLGPGVITFKSSKRKSGDEMKAKRSTASVPPSSRLSLPRTTEQRPLIQNALETPGHESRHGTHPESLTTAPYPSKQHGIRKQDGPYRCRFRFAGCLATFSKKNEWKRHCLNQHCVPDYYKCPKCSETPSFFVRKDLFKAHLLRMHTDAELKTQHELRQRQDKERKQTADPKRGKASSSTTNKAESEAAPGTDGVLDCIPFPHIACSEEYKEMCEAHEATATAAHTVRCSLPTSMKCPAPGCGQEHAGTDAWDKHMEHVAVHEKSVYEGSGEPYDFGGEVDEEHLIPWLVLANVIEWSQSEGAWAVVLLNTDAAWAAVVQKREQNRKLRDGEADTAEFTAAGPSTWSLPQEECPGVDSDEDGSYLDVDDD